MQTETAESIEAVAKPPFFKPVVWNTFIKDLFVIQIGFSLFGLAIVLLIRANLGTNPWNVLNVALSNRTGLSIGTFIMIIGAIVTILDVLLGEQIGWGTAGNIVFIGLWVDWIMPLIPSVEENLPVQAIMLLAGIWIMGIATALYIKVDAGAGPWDSLMLAIERISGWSIRVSRAAMEVIVVAIGWAMGGPAGIGTVMFALLIGPAVQWAFKVVGVKSHNR